MRTTRQPALRDILMADGSKVLGLRRRALEDNASRAGGTDPGRLKLSSSTLPPVNLRMASALTRDGSQKPISQLGFIEVALTVIRRSFETETRRERNAAR